MAKAGRFHGARAKASGAPLLVVSNRLPFAFHRGPRGVERRPSPGGLVSALEPVLRRRGGTWLGWPGGELPEGDASEPRDAEYRVRALSLSETEVAGYYHGFSNRTLWPLFHSLPERTRFDRRSWDVYRDVNRRFAEAAHEEATDVGAIWIHDYQLLLAPKNLRALGTNAPLAFFLHIPFPPYDLYRLLPWRRELLRGILACDLVGFQVGSYAENFYDCVQRLLDVEVDRETGRVEFDGRTTRVGAFPIGIDFDHFESLARGAPPAPPEGELLVLGADRLDYTKGIPKRIDAFERLLELHPEHRERVSLLQVAVPSRAQVAEYRALKREIDECVGRVNGRFATASWSPIRYLYQSLAHDRLAALYRNARVALVTPLRDGMNLVAKEYVACQVSDPGVLVLSELAGAAETMREALQVNPYDVDGTAEALHRALGMERSERTARMVALRRRERADDVHAWVAHFLESVRADERRPRRGRVERPAVAATA